MIRTQVQLTETQARRLKQLAQEKGGSIAALIREGVEFILATKTVEDEMREKRRMRAEEKAHRLPVLISIPLVVCMLPVMIGVLMLPATVRVVREILPIMSGAR